MTWLSKIIFGDPPEPLPLRTTKIYNVLGEQIDEVVGDLRGATLKNKQWPFVDLTGLCLDGADLESANLWGARLIRTSFCRTNLAQAEIAYANAEGADFSFADLRGTKLYKAETWHCRFDGALIDENSDIPGRKIVGTAVA